MKTADQSSSVIYQFQHLFIRNLHNSLYSKGRQAESAACLPFQLFLNKCNPAEHIRPGSAALSRKPHVLHILLFILFPIAVVCKTQQTRTGLQ